MFNIGFRVSITGQHEIKWLWIYVKTAPNRSEIMQL